MVIERPERDEKWGKKKTSAEDVSDYMLRHQAELLEALAAELRAQLKARHR